MARTTAGTFARLALMCCAGGSAAWAQPSNDECTGATPLPGTGGTFLVNFTGATEGAGDPSCLQGLKTVWYSYTAPSNGRIDVSTCGSETYSGVAIYDTCGHEVACNWRNDFCSADGLGAIFEYPVTAGQTVKIAVGLLPLFTGNTYLNVVPQVGPPPANDECATATSVTNGTYPVDTLTATGNAPFACSSPGMQTAGDVWYRYTATSNGLASAKYTVGTLNYVMMEVLDGCGGNSLDCYNYLHPGHGRLTWSTVAGHDYYVRISGVHGAYPAFGTGTIEFSSPQPPSNDTCANAQPIGLGNNTFDGSFAYDDSASPPCVNDDYGDVYFSFTPATTMYVYALAGYGVPTTSGVYDSLAVFDGCNGALIKCDDQDSNELPSFEWLAQAGHTYILRAATTVSRGTGSIFLRQVAMPAVNDECSGAIPVGVGTTTFNTTRFVAGAYTSTDPLYCYGNPFPGSDESPFNNDLWYSFTAPRTATYGFATVNGTFVGEIYDGCGGNSVACTLIPTIQPTGYDSWTGCFDAVAGSTYLIRVGQDFFTGGGAGQFTIEELDTSPFAIPPRAMYEHEQCGEPDTNGGCQMNPDSPSYETLTLCQPGTGTLAVDFSSGLQDMDSYHIFLEAGQTYVLEGQAETRTLILVSTAPNCFEGEPVALAHPDAICRFSFSSPFEAPVTGEYEVLVLLDRADISCGFPNRYWVRVGPAEGCPTPCPADFNGDGFPDGFDYDDFVTCFEGYGCPDGQTADFNQDGFADGFDYDDFVEAFETGCG